MIRFPFMLVTSMVLLVTAPAFHAAPTPGAIPHPPILIDGDAGFRGPGSGVVSGSGTAQDPFVIEGWLIPHTHGSGISIEGTRAHVEIRDVTIIGAWASHGVSLRDAENVTLTRVTLLGQVYGVSATDVQSLVVRDSALGSGPDAVALATSPASAPPTGLLGLDPARTPRPVMALMGTGIHLSGNGSDIAIAGNAFRGVETAVAAWRTGEARLDGILVCGNDIEGPQVKPAMRLRLVDDARVLGNRVVGESSGISASARGTLLVERNLFRDVDGIALDVTTAFGEDGTTGRVDAHGNVFEDNRVGAYAAGASDLTLNWWGDPSGPSGVGPGTGDPLEVPRGHAVPFEPWLTTRPVVGPEAVDCDAERAASRAGAGA